MPLRQPPAEQPFSLIPPNWNPVSNDRVLLHLEPCNSGCGPATFLVRITSKKFMARQVLSIGTASTK
jgi:hypothetical protein